MIKKWLDEVWIITYDSLPVLLGIGVAIVIRCSSFDTRFMFDTIWQWAASSCIKAGVTGPYQSRVNCFQSPVTWRSFYHNQSQVSLVKSHNPVIIIPDSIHYVFSVTFRTLKMHFIMSFVKVWIRTLCNEWMVWCANVEENPRQSTNKCCRIVAKVN